MKNIQVIDGARNCAYSVYQLTDAEFAIVFPAPDQDIEFIEDLIERVGEDASGKALGGAWSRELRKPDINGIHGTLFYELLEKKVYYPNKRESDIANNLYCPDSVTILKNST